MFYFFYVGHKIILTNGFIKKSNKTPKNEIKKALEYKFRTLCIKRIQGTKDIFEMTIAMGIRVTWQYTDNGILLRNNIGKHNNTLDNL
ncbi:type II toxin-antitoxin system RelE/ParE family toxin [Clostridium luticellarii]|uniref:type II toxin-antitoxin system RelE/ParE family toxin n=1 Tax=Clostridium luticellarii TaxID=1691940 RepID=UPI000D036E59|nr:type II toxin-antitoxin system RelE/ParE family toxin [Clostridium luticellarii]